MALYRLAVALAEQGRVLDAIEADRKALDLEPRYVPSRYHLAQLKTFTRDDPDLLALETLAGGEDAFEASELTGLFFALSKAYDDVCDYDQSFRYLRRANELRRETFEYDVAADVCFMNQTAAVFQPELFEHFRGLGSSSDLPILIVGMPRSGTSLVEQILASHPAVYGGGELEHLPELVTAVSLLNERGLGAPEGVTLLRSADLGGLGDAYEARLRKIGPAAVKVTDKQPLNFRHLGLARLIMPRARVIHCNRDPVDTCLSCYRELFGSIKFAFDLDELGRYYCAYAQLMQHWRVVLPRSWMLEVSYEDLVDDVERQARRIVAYCGLEWDDACLAFHANQRPVRTASFAQVRRPIYRNSVARWRRYERHLGPLLHALEPGSDRTADSDR
jgi:tetratricopeptide (TPR) repeat protein